MARPLRVNVPNGIYHVTSRGNRRQPIFLDDRDREVFLTMLATLSLRRHWRYHGYCLMPNHYHLVIETPQADLSSGMQYLNAGYADHFNFHHGTDGHLFQGRFHAVLVENDPHLLELARYLALNPVRAGLAATARGWRWSSYPAIAEGRRSPEFIDVQKVLSLFGRDSRSARRAFARFVEDAQGSLLDTSW